MRAVPALALALASCASPLPRFEAALAANESATAALGAWCGQRAIADPPTIRAVADRARHEPPGDAVLEALAIGEGEDVAYRHVRLACGNAVLSVAHNWYVPGRLEPAMNRTLETTDTPFGRVVAPLRFTRERLAARRGRMAECPAGTVLSHRAVLRRADRLPISLVVECYTRANLAGRPLPG